MPRPHEEHALAIIRLLRDDGHKPLCILKVGLHLVRTYALSKVDTSRGDSEVMAAMADCLRGCTEDTIMEMHAYRNKKFPAEDAS